jgi:hypothetical protein
VRTFFLFTLWAGELPFGSQIIKVYDERNTETVMFPPSAIKTTLTMATLQTPHQWHQLDLTWNRCGRAVSVGEVIIFASGQIILPTRCRRSGQTAWDRISADDDKAAV